ncbi:MAG: GNAT family N-acetyltransferase [Anaerolineaceae bacterium]|nr:GNAT family N-acetyltransferase [Anaerolineaceae bacterium]
MEAVSWLEKVMIRPIQEGDLLSLEWEGQYQHFRRVYAEAYQRTRMGKSVLWVADLLGAGVIGQVFIQLICERLELADGTHRAYLYAFRIRPEYRNQGLGSLILERVETDLRERGFQWITLNVARDNLRAQALYDRKGYRLVAPEPGIWSFQDENGQWRTQEEPAWRMEKYLSLVNSFPG